MFDGALGFGGLRLGDSELRGSVLRDFRCGSGGLRFRV